MVTSNPTTFLFSSKRLLASWIWFGILLNLRTGFVVWNLWEKPFFFYFFLVAIRLVQKPSARTMSPGVFAVSISLEQKENIYIAFCESCDIDFEYLTRSSTKWIAVNSIEVDEACYLTRYGAKRTRIDSMSNHIKCILVSLTHSQRCAIY